jgi:hypothetical protein
MKREANDWLTCATKSVMAQEEGLVEQGHSKRKSIGYPRPLCGSQTPQTLRQPVWLVPALHGHAHREEQVMLPEQE